MDEAIVLKSLSVESSSDNYYLQVSCTLQKGIHKKFLHLKRSTNTACNLLYYIGNPVTEREIPELSSVF